MKTQDNTYITHLLCWLFVFLLCLSVNAQKLPNVQPAGVKAPILAKADGKITEWGGLLQAYNRNTEVYYTLANNNDKLYLAVQTKDPIIIKKILAGGITFTANNSGKKNDPESKSVTFPILKSMDGTSVAIKLSEQPTAIDSAGKARQTDSLAKLMNTDMANKIKDIKLKGINAIPDSLISVYNEFGIRAAVAFDSKKTFTYELELPLKYLGLNIANLSKFSYNIMLNGLDKANVHDMAPNSRGLLRIVNVSNGFAPAGGGSMDSFVYPTDFWGEYTLVK